MKNFIIQKIKEGIVSTYTSFLEEDYPNNFKPRSIMILEELDSVQDSQ